MPTVTSYRNGLTAGMPGRNPNPSKRGNVTGWSAAAVRRHTKWLYSVDTLRLDGHGFALTLTMRDIPESATQLHTIRDTFMKRLEALGAVRSHWVIEWTKRGRPHLHAAVYFRDFEGLPEGFRTELLMGELIIHSWVNVARKYGTSPNAQHWDLIDGPLGWLQYLSKHAARGVKHYQRSGHPEGWERTGRLWGYRGKWPVDAPARYDMSREAYWRYRRLVRSWRVSDARMRPLSPKRGAATRGDVVKHARRMLASSNPKLSAVRGVSDWIPESVNLALIGLLIADGFDISERTETPSADS